MKKPDRFTRLAITLANTYNEHYGTKQRNDTCSDCVNFLAQTLRREHQAVARMVQRLRHETNGPTCDYDRGAEDMCHTILARLWERGK